MALTWRSRQVSACLSGVRHVLFTPVAAVAESAREGGPFAACVGEPLRAHIYNDGSPPAPSLAACPFSHNNASGTRALQTEQLVCPLCQQKCASQYPLSHRCHTLTAARIAQTRAPGVRLQVLAA